MIGDYHRATLGAHPHTRTPAHPIARELPDPLNDRRIHGHDLREPGRARPWRHLLIEVPVQLAGLDPVIHEADPDAQLLRNGGFREAAVQSVLQ